MDEPLLGEILVVAVGELEAGNVGSVHLAVLDVELRADGLGLEHGEALRRAPVDDILEVRGRARRARVRAGLVNLFLVEAPVRVAEVEERRAVRVGEVLGALRRLHEAALVDLEVARVRLRLQRAGLAVERGVAAAGGGPAPASGLRGREAHAEGLAAVPEAGTRHLLARRVREHGVERHGVRARRIVVRARLEGASKASSVARHVSTSAASAALTCVMTAALATITRMNILLFISFTGWSVVLLIELF